VVPWRRQRYNWDNLLPAEIFSYMSIQFGPHRTARVGRRGLVFYALALSLIACGCGTQAPRADATKKGAEPAASTSGEALAKGAVDGAIAGDASAHNIHSVRVAAASDLQFALKDLAAQLQTAHPEFAVEIVFGSSGNLYAQLTNTAPFDMFLSADMSYPRRLVEANLASAESEFLYAIGQIVVWVSTSSALDLDKLGIRALADPSVKKIAIANPKHAPYGRVAEAAMQKLGVYDDVKDRLVLGENISQTAQFVESGAADIGIIALSLAMAPAMKDKGRYWPVPQDAYPRLEQGGIIMNNAQDPMAAHALRTFLTGEEGKSILRTYGFVMPEE
jgi:molybdate transport system substrate-binding protein